MIYDFKKRACHKTNAKQLFQSIHEILVCHDVNRVARLLTFLILGVFNRQAVLVNRPVGTKPYIIYRIAIA
jgi:hypothetical protein